MTDTRTQAALGPLAVLLAVALTVTVRTPRDLVLLAAAAAVLLVVAVPLLAVVLAAFLPLVTATGAVAAGPVTLPRLLAVLLVVRVLAAAPQRVGPAVQSLVPLLALFAWLALRSLGSPEGVQQALDLARLGLLAIVVLVLVRPEDEARTRTVMALAALLFLVLNSVLGDDTLSGTRWQGLTGNPNLLAGVVAGVAPLCLCGAPRTWGPWRGSALAGTYLLLAVPLVIRTQSREGAVLLAVACLASVAVSDGTARRTFGARLGRLLFGVLACISVLVVVVRGLEPSRLGRADLASLSGRLEAYGKAWDAFQSSPLVGAGGAGQFLPALDLSLTGTQSAHNAYLSILGQGGLVAACLAVWVALAVLRRPRRGSLGRATTACLATFAVAGLVGDQHLLEVTWVVYALALVPERAGRQEQQRAVQVVGELQLVGRGR